MKVFLSRHPLGVVRAKSESLVEPFGRRMVHLDQERHPLVLLSLVTRHDDALLIRLDVAQNRAFERCYRSDRLEIQSGR